jgi:hypothetical protein
LFLQGKYEYEKKTDFFPVYKHITNTNTNKMIKVVDTFCNFVWFEDNDVVDACVDAMKKQKLHVCAKSRMGRYLWESHYSMQALQWQRLCDILRQQGIGTSVLWSIDSSVYHTPLVADLDCMWEDLDGVEATMNKQPRAVTSSWVFSELRRRQGWRNGLRRAWLAAVVFAG